MAQQVKHGMQQSPPKQNFTDSQIEEFKHAFALFDKVILDF